uniref:Uncharacterized protein n=1 Tax=Amphimedon queenslandica TaxID=400682 RepID=A0A1X7V144_AMPQE
MEVVSDGSELLLPDLRLDLSSGSSPVLILDIGTKLSWTFILNLCCCWIRSSFTCLR